MNTIEAARDYWRRDWRIVPVAAGAKGCHLPGWQSLVIAEDGLHHVFSPGDNVAVVLGEPSGELVDIDLDCDEALAIADIYLPQTGAIFGRKSRPRSHRLYIAPGARFASYADPADGDMLIELRAGGAHQTLLPPSVADGEQRVWHGNTIVPGAIDAHKLVRRCVYLAIGCMVSRHVSEHAAQRPQADLPRLLWEADEELGRAAFHWLGQLAPDEEPRRLVHRRRDDDDIDLARVVAAIPNRNEAWPEWNALGMAIFAATQGSQDGLQIFDKFSRQSVKYDPRTVAERWSNFRRHPPTRIGIGTLIYRARQAGWRL